MEIKIREFKGKIWPIDATCHGAFITTPVIERQLTKSVTKRQLTTPVRASDDDTCQRASISKLTLTIKQPDYNAADLNSSSWDSILFVY